MSNQEADKKLNKHILNLKTLIDMDGLRQLSTQTGFMGEMFIRSHSEDAKYLGGTHQHRGYSTTALPIFFFGASNYVPKTQNVRLNAPKFNISNLLIKKEDVFWIKRKDGSSVAYLKDGYSTFLKYARPGKNLNKVDHTFTGQMLNALTHDFTITTKKAEIRFFVRSPHHEKAYYTNLIRQWMGFFDEEIDQIKKMASDKYGLILTDHFSK